MVHPSTLPPMVRGEPFPMTWEEFLEWSPDEGQSEWVDGEGIAYVSNSARHGELVRFLGALIGRFAQVFNLGEVFSESLLMRLMIRPAGRMPDVFVIGRAERHRLREYWYEGPALFVVEVVSIESVARDTVEKRAEYERAGIAEYLIVEARPDRRGITFLSLDEDGRYQAVEPDEDGRYHSTALPGFWIDPVWLDQDPLPDIDRIMFRIAPAAYRRYLERLLAEAPE